MTVVVSLDETTETSILSFDAFREVLSSRSYGLPHPA